MAHRADSKLIARSSYRQQLGNLQLEPFVRIDNLTDDEGEVLNLYVDTLAQFFAHHWKKV